MDDRKKFYVDMGGKSEGPFSVEELQTLYHEGKITRQTLFSSAGATEWLPVSLLVPPQPVPVRPGLKTASLSFTLKAVGIALAFAAGLVVLPWAMSRRDRDPGPRWEYLIWNVDHYPKSLLDPDKGITEQFEVILTRFSNVGSSNMTAHYWTNTAWQCSGVLNILGEEGWDLAAFDNSSQTLILKRPRGTWFWTSFNIWTRRYDLNKHAPVE
jgi:hypothetical protein